MLDNPTGPNVLLTFGKVRNPLHLPRKTTSEPSKVVRACGVFYLETRFVPQRRISTSKNAPNLVCFVHFDLELCFAPQRRAEAVSSCTFHLEMCFAPQGVPFFIISTSKSGLRPSVFYVLRATTVCTFSASQLQKVLRS